MTDQQVAAANASSTRRVQSCETCGLHRHRVRRRSTAGLPVEVVERDGDIPIWAEHVVARGARAGVALRPTLFGYQFQFELFGRAVRKLGKLPFAPEDGLGNTMALDALLQSARTGSVVLLK